MADFETKFKDRKEFVKFCRPYDSEAYSFVMASLDFLHGKLPEKRHVSGKELLEAIREFGIKEYGPMARDVFEHWGIKKTEDFGKIVFKLIDVGLMAKSETDSIEDFKNVYDFKKTFSTDINKTASNISTK